MKNPNTILSNLGYKDDPRYQDVYGEMCRDLATRLQNETHEQAMRGFTIRWGPARQKETMSRNASPVKFLGEDLIDPGLRSQVFEIAKLPGVTRVAVFPDAHVGQGWAIGTVTEAENRVFPNAVGVDIACRMHLTILPISQLEAFNMLEMLTTAMRAVSRFGLGGWQNPANIPDHPVMSDPRWREYGLAKSLYNLARSQLGTSGMGNHFFDLLPGTVIRQIDGFPFLPGDKIVAIMTHSGSRGPGAKIASHFQKLAKDNISRRGKGIKTDLAWLDMDTDPGYDYWRHMELMGDYARANHEIIHHRFIEAVFGPWSKDPFYTIDNHHNFAWIENGKVVHRKGATPAFEGEYGVIPGSSGDPSLVVRGLGNAEYLNSSSHGVGRPFSRTEAKRRWTQDDVAVALSNARAYGVTPDESPMAYKDAEAVFGAQEGIVFETVVKLDPPWVVLMGGSSKNED